MAFTKEEAQAALAPQQQQADEFRQALAMPVQPGILQTMLQRGMAPGTSILGRGGFGGGGGLAQQIRAAQGVKPFLRETFEPPAATLAGGVGEIKRLAPDLFPPGGALPGEQAFLPGEQQALAGLRARRPEQAKAGKGLADVAAFLAARRAPAGLLGKIGGRGLLPTVGRKLATGFPAGAAVSPQHRILGGALGSAAEATPELLGSMFKNFPKLLLGKLAKTTVGAVEKMKAIGKQLYDKTFEGTDDLQPELSDKGKQSIEDLKNVFTSGASKVRKAVDIYEKNPSIRGIHKLRSSLSKKFSSNLDVIQKKGLETPIETEQTALENTVDNLAQDTRTNLAKISPEKVKQYDVAQKHWRENVVPLREFAPIRKLLGKQKLAEPSLFKAFAGKVVRGKEERETPTEAIRRIVGVPRGIAQTGQFLHRKYLGIPVGIWLGAGIGSGIGIGRHKL